jgi:hypothetical protein
MQAMPQAQMREHNEGKGTNLEAQTGKVKRRRTGASSASCCGQLSMRYAIDALGPLVAGLLNAGSVCSTTSCFLADARSGAPPTRLRGTDPSGRRPDRTDASSSAAKTWW